MKLVTDWGFLRPADNEYDLMKMSIKFPIPFTPENRLDRPSMKFLRDEQIYEMFYPTTAMEEAWSILSDPEKRLCTEQLLLSRLDLKMSAQKINKKRNWFLTEDGLKMFGHYFWNVKLLTFDEWGRFLYSRTAMYEQYMSLLRAPQQLSFYLLRLDQTLESKQMIQRAQEIAYFTLEEVAQKPGTGIDKVKAIGVLSKSIVDCHNALSTSDMALKDVLKQFERFRMEYPQVAAPDIRQLAPGGNYSGSGVQEKKEEKVH